MVQEYMNIKLLSIFLCTTITACSANIEKTSAAVVICKDPRPQMCTRDYRPVCGLISDSKVKTYSNGCSACGEAKVLSYTEDVCSDNSSRK